MEANQNHILMGYTLEMDFLFGIDIFLSQGHTLGLMHPIVSDGNRTIFYGSDLFPTAAHIPVQWVMSYDIQPMVSIKEKHKLLKKMFQKLLIFLFQNTANAVVDLLAPKGF